MMPSDLLCLYLKMAREVGEIYKNELLFEG